MFLIATVGALTISLVVTAATFTRGLSALTGLPDNFTMQAFVILLSGGIFCMSSWIGINNGLQRLSKMVGWGAFLLPLVVLLVGPTEFITNNIINAVGLTTQNFLQMSLFTDPLGAAPLPATGPSSTGCGGSPTPQAWRCSSPASPAGAKSKR